MATGTVKWFNDARGFGFIVGEDPDGVFRHHTSIDADGFRSLAEGQKVEFEVKRGPKGLTRPKISAVAGTPLPLPRRPLAPASSPECPPKRIFISYSHNDKQLLARL